MQDRSITGGDIIAALLFFTTTFLFFINLVAMPVPVIFDVRFGFSIIPMSLMMIAFLTLLGSMLSVDDKKKENKPPARAIKLFVLMIPLSFILTFIGKNYINDYVIPIAYEAKLNSIYNLNYSLGTELLDNYEHIQFYKSLGIGIENQTKALKYAYENEDLFSLMSRTGLADFKTTYKLINDENLKNKIKEIAADNIINLREIKDYQNYLIKMDLDDNQL